MNVLVWGGTGFLGRPLVRTLLERGHHVGVFHRGEVAGSEDGEVHLRGDRGNGEDLRRAMDRFAPDVVVDLLARTEAEAQVGIEAMQQRCLRVIVISSIDVYAAYERLGGRGDGVWPVPLDEDAPLRTSRFPRRRRHTAQPTWERDYDKVLVEAVYGTADMPWTILRLPFVYGPGDYRDRLAPWAQAAVRGDREVLIPLDKAGWRCTRGFVSDMALAIVATLECEEARTKVFNVGEAEALTELEWAQAILDVAGSPGVVRVAQTPDDRCAWQQSLVVDTRRIRTIAGYEEGCTRQSALEETWRAFAQPAR